MKFEMIDETLIFRRCDVKSTADKQVIADLLNIWFCAHCYHASLEVEDIENLMAEYPMARYALQIEPGEGKRSPYLKLCGTRSPRRSKSKCLGENPSGGPGVGNETTGMVQ